jgi:hypothetical protein
MRSGAGRLARQGIGGVMSPARFDVAVVRVRAEFMEMPGLRLTIPQAARLLGLDQADCHDVIDALVHGAFLRQTSSGLIERAEDAK